MAGPIPARVGADVKVAEGGSARIAHALVGELASLGGRIEADRWVETLDSLPRARAVFLYVTPESWPPSPVTGSRPGTAGRWQVSRTVPASARPIGRCPGQCPGRPQPPGRHALPFHASQVSGREHSNETALSMELEEDTALLEHHTVVAQ